jgi:hypothetical protein
VDAGVSRSGRWRKRGRRDESSSVAVGRRAFGMAGHRERGPPAT